MSVQLSLLKKERCCPALGRAPLTCVEHPEVSQPAAVHASVDDEPVVSSAGRHHRRVTLPGWRRVARGHRDLPAHHAGARPQLQAVQVVEIPGGGVESRAMSGSISNGELLELTADKHQGYLILHITQSTWQRRALITTWGCCSWGLRCHWPGLQTGSNNCQSERSCVPGGGRGAGRSSAPWPSDASTPSDSPAGDKQ